MEHYDSKTLRHFKLRTGDLFSDMRDHKGYTVHRGCRSWEKYYHGRWGHDRISPSTHGVNCTGSCRWNVYVKDGIIVWEAQAADYPTPHADFPDYEPRGCPRGASASWYVYSPLRVRYPYIRGELLNLWRQALKEKGDPVAAWEDIQNDPGRRGAYQKARGMGGFVRFSWDEALTLISASLIYTIRRYGPDRIFGFTPLPAMSMVSFASGARFFSMLGASMISFYDWYCDLPPASPQVWGEQTDVCESADWYNAGYIISWGSNLPQTRTPDAHFYTEARYQGTKIAAVSPDYADFTKFADTWLPVRAGTDGALAMAMTHVIMREFFIERQVPYFQDYVRRFTDLPFLLELEEKNGALVPGRYLRASDFGHGGNNPEWKLVVFDTRRGAPAVPMGSIGSRWGEKGTWNLEMRDCYDGKDLAPALSMEERAGASWELVDFPVFSETAPTLRKGAVPVVEMEIGGARKKVTTVFDILAASLAVDRGHGGDVARFYEDGVYPTPAWQEGVTGVPAADVIKVAREFADNAEKTRGRSLIIMGAGINHWYHNDINYRAILNLTSLCGCQGVAGGGWAHYVGQEKVRPQAGWATLTTGTDWFPAPRRSQGTTFYYFATDSWRHELLNIAGACPATHKGEMPEHPADCFAIAARLGWMPYYPQFRQNPIQICEDAARAGASTDEEIVDYAVKGLQDGRIQMAIENPDSEENVPRFMMFWRANPLGSNVKGHEYFLRYLLGTKASALSEESERKPTEFHAGEAMRQGKLDLMVTAEIRMNTSAVYSDIVLPSAHWYEYNDLSTTDLHPFIHPFTEAVDPPWEARDNWSMFALLARKFSAMAATHLGVRKDLVASALEHDSPNEVAQPMGEVKDWTKGETAPVPGKTMFNLRVVERNYADMFKMYSALGPNVQKPDGVGTKGVKWCCATEYEVLKRILGVVDEPGVSHGMPRITCGKDACEVVLTLSPESNGRVSVRSWGGLEEKTGRELADMSKPIEGVHLTFQAVSKRPRKGFTAPEWSGIEADGRTYTPFQINVERLVPFRTLSGRQHFYLDHAWMRALGEALPAYQPPLPLAQIGETSGKLIPRGKQDLVLNFLSVHSKWSIHSSYSDVHLMRVLSRGGGEVWLNDEDAASVGIKDNDWLECYNANGAFVGRAVVTHRLPRGKTFIHHAQERLINVPMSSVTGNRGGTHNSLTRALVNPAQMIGGYGQFSYSFNYYGPTGCQRDEMIVVRKAEKVVFDEN
ncbi:MULTISPECIES: nitrate reductase subunit alpha [unclassified Desulfovibrio]|uniref:nitrate reductase subunit alpha n=1 Tax=unclassified Desulfovibrio TaxID=2593640 RepID=UPI0013ECD09C|nr:MULTISPECIES: nitrate reductase subunit alpha [unclassified Desulfovibrio]